MSDFFVGEIRWFPFDWAPKGWLPCDGRSLQVSQNQALYALLGTTYGGNPPNTFNLPDLRGRSPVHIAAGQSGYALGNQVGTETVTLTLAQMPAHSHVFLAEATNGTTPLPAGKYLAKPVKPDVMTEEPLLFGANSATQATMIALNPGNVTQSGGGQSHENMQPFQVLNPCIATTGLFPPHP